MHLSPLNVENSLETNSAKYKTFRLLKFGEINLTAGAQLTVSEEAGDKSLS